MNLLSLLISSPITALSAILCLVAALTVHEWAHAWVAYKLGDDTPYYDGRVTLNPLAHLDPLGTIAFLIFSFGWGKPVLINPNNFKRRSDELLVALAGPASNLVFALLLNLLAFAVGGIFGELLRLASLINVSLAAFNILPIPPLDGSSIIDIFFPGYKQLGGSLPALIGLLILINLPIGDTTLIRYLMNPVIHLFSYLTTLGWHLS